MREGACKGAEARAVRGQIKRPDGAGDGMGEGQEHGAGGGIEKRDGIGREGGGEAWGGRGGGKGEDVSALVGDAPAHRAGGGVAAEEFARGGGEAGGFASGEAEPGDGFDLVPLEDLVRMKLTSFRDKDRMHLRDLASVGLVDSWPQAAHALVISAWTPLSPGSPKEVSSSA